MGVVRTDKWLYAYLLKSLELPTVQERMAWQQQTIVEPLSDIFQTTDVAGLHYYLLQIGLFHPSQNLSDEIDLWKDVHPWSIIQNQLIHLKQKWNGPDVKVYVLPINRESSVEIEKLGGKTGISLPNAIILFISPTLTEDDLRALLTHEYHHICRLSETNQTEESMTFLESMVMEGLAELAVREEIGPHACAIWTKYHDENWNPDWFERWINANLFVVGRNKYHYLLYGDKKTGIPIWLGYYTGYKIVESATLSSDTAKKLITENAEVLLHRSKFSNGGEIGRKY